MKKIGLFVLGLVFSISTYAQKTSAKQLLDQVSEKMGAYTNMTIGFSSKLVHKEAGLLDEAPINGTITLKGEQYNLDYLGNKFIFNGKRLVVINKEEKEISITDGNLEEEDGFIYPSKLLTFYKDGYNYAMGKLVNIKGRKIQYVNLTPIDSNSDIKKVLLGIDAKTKHIYKLTQIGSNGAETTFTINNFKSNQAITNGYFGFDKAKYVKQGYLID